MTKKILIVTLVSVILSLSCGFCFAAQDEGAKNVNLGNEISSSLNKGADSVGNVADGIVGAGEEVVDDVGNGIKDMWDGDNRNNNDDNNEMWNGNRGTDGYSTMRTTTEGTQTTNGMMSSTTWMWIIFAIAAVIIVAAVWFYAMQGSNRD